MPNFAFHNFEQLLKHVENTGKTHGAYRENTGNIQGKHMEPTGKTHGKHMEPTGKTQGTCTKNTGITQSYHNFTKRETYIPKHMEHTAKTQGLHVPTITTLYRSVCFGKIKNTKKIIRLTKIFLYQISHFIILNNF